MKFAGLCGSPILSIQQQKFLNFQVVPADMNMHAKINPNFSAEMLFIVLLSWKSKTFIDRYHPRWSHGAFQKKLLSMSQSLQVNKKKIHKCNEISAMLAKSRKNAQEQRCT